jgi:8-oxo-dGTP pyrophosphatase MutT (NUDIX family)
MTRNLFDRRDEQESLTIVNGAHAKAETAPKPAVSAMIEELEEEIGRRLSSASAWTRDGYDVTGDEWVRRLSILVAVVRLLKFVKAHEREIAKAVKK